MDIAAPFGIYLILCSLPDLPVLLIVLLIVLAAAILFSAYTHFATGSRRVPIRKRLTHFLHSSRLLTSLFLAGLFVVCVTGSVFGHTLLPPEKPQKFQVESNETLNLEDHLKELQPFISDTWADLTVEQKLDALQVIANLEAAYLGLPDEITLEIADLEDRTLGNFSQDSHIIHISRAHLENSSSLECLDTLFHEAYHNYQYELCMLYGSLDSRYRTLLGVRDGESYTYEFNNYTSGKDDHDQYAKQLVESNARKYASERLKEYRPLIYKLEGRTVDLDIPES